MNAPYKQTQKPGKKWNNQAPRQGGGKDARKQDVHAPYNFVPLSDWIFTPDWADQASQDIPFEDGLCGTLEYSLTAHTPLLIGDERKGGNAPTTFFRLPDGTSAIPGTSLKGMIRSVLEIASFGKMQALDNPRLGIRDISGKRVKDSYINNLFKPDKWGMRTPRAGLLRMSSDGSAQIMPCRFVRVSHRDMELWVQQKNHGILFRKGMSVSGKYAHWQKTATQCQWIPDSLDIHFDIAPAKQANDPTQHDKAVNLGKGEHKGRLVFTGQICDRSQDKKIGNKTIRGKYLDFIFYDSAPEPLPALSEDAWRSFLLIHDDETGNTERPWPDFWKKKYYEGEEVPVFYRLNDAAEVESLGLAYMYKLAYRYSIHETVEHTHRDHIHSSRLDLAETLFGTVNKTTDIAALKGRVSFGLMKAEDTPSLDGTTRAILNQPKPTYFPSYLYQGPGSESGELPGNNYITYMDENARIRGWKRYPAQAEPRKPSLTPKQNQSTQVQVHLQPLASGSRFKGKLRFHNLKPEELGALVWAMTWGGDDSCRHALGMGKPFGFGQVSLNIDEDGSVIHPNGGAKPPSLGECMQAFVVMMQSVHNHGQRGDWLNSEQMFQLLGMARPGNCEGKNLSYMRLSNNQGHNEFVDAKKSGSVLPHYMSRTGTGGSGIAPGSGNDIELQHPWLRETVEALMVKYKTRKQEVVFGKALAAAWQEMDDPAAKAAALDEITRIWKRQDQWDNPGGRAAKQALAIYKAHSG